MENNLKVMIWGREVGRLSWDVRRKRSVFEYNPDFLNGDMDIAPLTNSIKSPSSRLPFFGQPNDNIYFGLPAFISDSLSGQWGNTVFSAWARANRINERDLTSVDKLFFIGNRAMGALEFQPAKEIGTDMSIELDELYRKAQEILEKREEVVIDGNDLSLNSLYEVGTSAGGQHTKTVIARNNATGEIRSGQILLPPEYTYYILKFAEPNYMPLTVVEYIYNRMAANAGIDVMPCELLSIDGAQHFLTERFDRKDGRKIHIQSLAAMNPEANSYEDLMWACDDLGLPYSERKQMYMRMVFNILTTNVDAHVKNFSFMLEEGGEWHTTPAYDLTFSCFNHGNRFDPAHSLSVCGKYMNIGKEDMVDFGKRFGIRDTGEVIESVSEAVMGFRSIAEELDLDKSLTNRIEQHFAEMNPEIL